MEQPQYITTDTTHLENTKNNREPYAILGGGVRVPLEDVLKVSAAGFNIASSKAKYANPAPLGFAMWFLGCITAGLYHCSALDVQIVDMIAAFGLLTVGVGSYIVGNLEVLCENSFGSAAMTTFGMFWMSWGASFISSFGIAEAYAKAPEQLSDAKGLYFVCWFIAFFFLTWCTVRTTVVFFGMFTTFTLALLMQIFEHFLRSDSCKLASGVFMVISGCLALASFYGSLATPETAYIFGKSIPMPNSVTRS